MRESPLFFQTPILFPPALLFPMPLTQNSTFCKNHHLPTVENFFCRVFRGSSRPRFLAPLLWQERRRRLLFFLRLFPPPVLPCRTLFRCPHDHLGASHTHTHPNTPTHMQQHSASLLASSDRKTARQPLLGVASARTTTAAARRPLAHLHPHLSLGCKAWAPPPLLLPVALVPRRTFTPPRLALFRVNTSTSILCLSQLCNGKPVMRPASSLSLLSLSLPPRRYFYFRARSPRHLRRV